jgi:hypothetical protein
MIFELKDSSSSKLRGSIKYSGLLGTSDGDLPVNVCPVEVLK